MVNLKIKNKDYCLRLTTKGCVNCEKRLGVNPINVFMEASDNKIPKMSELMIILHECMLPYEHKLTIDDVYDLYDEYCCEGGNLMTLIELLVEVFQDSGFIPKTDGKN